ncbi:MAG: hypothetical protein RIS88_2593 [Pseudomonadota bacterium]|jgi:hypothetical protein
MKRAWTWALALLVAGSVAPSLACPANADLTARDLLGAWRADIAGTWLTAHLELEPNPDWPGSLAGRVRRGDRLARLAGDLEDGTFTLEESADGVRIDATWVGQPVEGSCGREIRGTWQPAGDSVRRGFTLRRVGSDRRGS